MRYTKIRKINEYVSQSINPMKTPNVVFEMYSVPVYDTGHPEYLRGEEIASSKILVEKDDVLLCKINPRINRVWVVNDESDKQNIASSEWIVIRSKEYNPEFLAWYFRTRKFQNLMTSEVTGIGGSLTRAQPKRVAEYPVPILERKKQDEIVCVLNKTKSIITERKQELLQLDNIIKSRFVEMFGNVLVNDRQWDMFEWNQVLRIVNGKNQRGVECEDGSYLICGSGGPIGKATDYLVKENSVIIGRKGNINKPILMREKFWNVDTAFGLEPNIEIIIVEYLYYYCCFYNFERLNKAVTIPSLTKADLLKVEMPIPDIRLQNQFADFVHQVDKLKLEVQKSLDETQMLMDSLMQQYFG